MELVSMHGGNGVEHSKRDGKGYGMIQVPEVYDTHGRNGIGHGKGHGKVKHYLKYMKVCHKGTNYLIHLLWGMNTKYATPCRVFFVNAVSLPTAQPEREEKRKSEL
jgi:hypothetical protein